MAKRRRNDTYCLNCHSELNITDSFCPQCGQENTTNKVPLGELVKDIISNYFNLDTRFGRAIIPFLFKPGSLTVDFNLGHRLKYMHPLKLYIMMSLIYFFVFSWFTMPVIEEYFGDMGTTGEELGKLAKNNTVVAENFDSLVNTSINSSEQALKDLNEEGLGYLSEEQTTVLLDSLTKLKKDSLLHSTNEDGSISVAFNLDSLDDKESFSIQNLLKWQEVLKVIQNREMTPKRLLDSLEFSDGAKKNTFVLKIAEQTLKIGRNDPHIFATNIIDNIPVMMLFLLPILAMYLKLIYIRSSKYYIEHLIFTLHIQAFIYFIFALGLFAMNWLDFLDVSFLMGIFIFIYSFAMFLRVYKQNWFKTFIKMHILAFLYFFSLVIFLCFEVLVSFFIF
jgi:hypothetical protein